jgi:hypothetical protein
MAYERMLFANAVCFLGAVVAVNGFKPVPFGASTYYTVDEHERLDQIEKYLKRCIILGAIPARRWPLYGIEPAPLAHMQDGLMVSLADFRAWIETSKVAAPVTWADAVCDSIQWDDQPIPGTNVITGEQKGRPRKLLDNAQAEANEIALELYKIGGAITQKSVATKLAARHDMKWSSVKDRFSVERCKEHVKALKQ